MWYCQWVRLAIIWITLGSIGCGGRTLVPSPNLYVNSETNPFAKVPEAFQGNEVNVLYVTDREPIVDKNETVRYGYERSSSMAFGAALVRIGDDVSWDDLVEASRTHDRKFSLPVTVEGIFEAERFPETPFPYDQSNDVRGKKIRLDPEVVAEHERVTNALKGEIRDRLSFTPKKDVFVFVHGFNNDFDHSVSVIAEIWHFLARQGVPVAYSWPAGRGGSRGYFYDRESGEFTIFHLKQFLRILASCEEVEKIHLVAHSRGTDVLLTALRELYIELGGRDLEPGESRKLGNVILAAPDMDVGVIQQRISAEELHTKIARLTMYMSKTDTAIGLSTWLFDSKKRLGRVEEKDFDKRGIQRAKSVHLQGLALIDANVYSGFIGHSYFYSHPAVLSDLILILRENRDPGAEHGRPLQHVGNCFWSIDEDYPSDSAK